jgi:HKD family nuclease
MPREEKLQQEQGGENRAPTQPKGNKHKQLQMKKNNNHQNKATPHTKSAPATYTKTKQ